MQAAQGDLVKYNWILDNSNRGDLERALDMLRIQELKNDIKNCYDDKAAKPLQQELKQLLYSNHKKQNDEAMTAIHQVNTNVKSGFGLGKRLPIIKKKD